MRKNSQPFTDLPYRVRGTSRVLLNSHNNFLFTKEITKAQRGEGTCPGSQSWKGKVAAFHPMSVPNPDSPDYLILSLLFPPFNLTFPAIGSASLFLPRPSPEEEPIHHISMMRCLVSPLGFLPATRPLPPKLQLRCLFISNFSGRF